MAMSDEHKAALALGRKEARAIKGYLRAIAGRKPGRPVSPERLAKKIADLGARIDQEADPLKAVELRQERIDAQHQLAQLEAHEDIEELEAGFIANAASYSQRKGISYAAWREQGVPAAVLKQANIGRNG